MSQTHEKVNANLIKLILAALFLALAMVLPFLTGQVPQIGSMLCPMHIPVLLCGFFCGPVYGLLVGLAAPALRFFLFGMPPLMPVGAAMTFELAAYGLTAGLLYRALPKKKIYVYVTLIAAMILGRLVWGAAEIILMGLGKITFSWKAFLTGAVINALPGIILQIVLIPALVIVLRKFTSSK